MSMLDIFSYLEKKRNNKLKPLRFQTEIGLYTFFKLENKSFCQDEQAYTIKVEYFLVHISLKCSRFETPLPVQLYNLVMVNEKSYILKYIFTVN